MPRYVTEADAPHHRPGGGFRNPWPGAIVDRRGRGRRFLHWRLERLRDRLPPDPRPEALPHRDSQVAHPGARVDELRVTWVGHATLLIQFSGLNVLTDPVWSQRASPLDWAGPRRLTAPGLPFEALPPIDAVLLSHDHYDHLDRSTVERIASRHPEAAWLAPLGHRAWLAARGVRRVAECDWWQDTVVGSGAGGLRAVALPAQHWSARSPFGAGRRLWCSWVLADDLGHRIYFGGDSGYFPGYREIGAAHGPFDLLALPIGAYAPRWFMRPMHMNPEEAVQAYRDLGGRGAFVAIHWGTFRLSDEDPLEPPVRLRAAWHRAGLAEDDLWILAHGETRVRATPISEIP